MRTPDETTVLVVEDSPFLRYAARAILQRRGYAVLEAADGQEAMEILAESRPDLILLDLVIPRLSGEEVLRAIAHHPDLRTIPVLVISNLEQAEAASGVSTQVQGYFHKATTSLNTLPDRVESVLRRHRGNAGLCAGVLVALCLATAPAAAQQPARAPTGRAAIAATATVVRSEEARTATKVAQALLRRVPADTVARREGIVWVKLEPATKDHPRRVRVEFLAN